MPTTDDKDLINDPPRKKKRLAPPIFESSFVGPVGNNRASSSRSHLNSNRNPVFLPTFETFQSDFATTSKHAPVGGLNAGFESNPKPSPKPIIKSRISDDFYDESCLNERFGIQDEEKSRHEKQKEMARSMLKSQHPNDSMSAALTNFASAFDTELSNVKHKKYSTLVPSSLSGKSRFNLSTDGPISFQDTFPLLAKNHHQRREDKGTEEINSEPEKGRPPKFESESESRPRVTNLQTLTSIKSHFIAADPSPTFLSAVRPSLDLRGVRLPNLSASTTRPHVTSVVSHLAQLNDVMGIAQQKLPEKFGSEKKLVPLLLNLPVQSGSENQVGEVVGTPTIPLTHHGEQLADLLRNQKKEQPRSAQLSELTRGIEISPQKHSKEYVQERFVRGGLAERADRFFSKSSTSFSLWQISLLKNLDNTPIPPKEDLRLLILSVTSYIKHPGGPAVSSPPRGAVTLCREVLPGADRDGEVSSQEGIVIFLFSNHEKISSAMNFEEGRHVCVWRPWQEVDLPRMDDESALSAPGLSKACVPPTSQGPGDRTVALFCSRFLVLD